MAYFDDNDALICSYTCKWIHILKGGWYGIPTYIQFKTYNVYYEVYFRTSFYQSSSTIITLILSFVEKVLFKADKI